nr:ankyrin repeat domain-containing protein [Rickettsia endosymbiont of Ceutorhynchus assimilis]
MSQLAINHVNKNGETALTWATYKGLDKVCELLIPKMSQQAINQINNNGWTALSLATKNGFKNICDLLQKTDNYEKLIEAIKTKNTTEAQKLIAKMDILELSKVDNGGETALTLAAYKGLDKVCELLIPKMSNEAINQINNYGNTALILATKNGFKNICDLLTNKEEQQQAYNQQLILAIEENKIEEAKNLIFLINSKYLNNVDNNNNTALHYTVDKSLTELSMVLIQKMSKEAISIRNIYNNTALHYATDNGLEEVSWFLINKMTQEALDMVNIYGNTALDYAIYNKLIITGFLAKKMSLEVVKTVNANCTGDLANIEYKNIEQYNKTREHEKIIGQCFSLPIKEPSPLSLKEENTSNSEVGLALLAPFSIITTLIVGYFSYLFWNYLRKNSDQKAETFNTQGNIFCGKEEYNKAIEKYKEAIAISKNPLYVTNKTNAEKKYEEQQQSLKLKQTTSIINENKPADIKDLPKEVTKQDLAQENLREKLATFQKIVVETITKLESNTTINEKDKAVLQDRINEIAKTVKTFLNKADIDIITKSMEELASGKITKARIAVVEEDLIEIIEQRVKLEEGMRTEKLAIFEKIIEEMTTKLKGNTTISEKDKDIMQDSINRIVSKVQSLANKTDIETITEIIKELVNGKITKARLGVVEEDIDQLIEQQSKPSHDVIVNKVTMEMLVDLEDKIDETTKIDSLTRIDQLSIFKLVVAKVITNLENDKTITANNKVSMQNSINEIISGVSRLTNVSDIEKITASMKEFTTGGITKDKLIDLEGELDIIIVLQMNEATNEITTWAVTEIIYDKPLLNHPKLLQAAVNSKLAHDLIQEAINNNDEELILAGLISVGYDVTTIG